MNMSVKDGQVVVCGEHVHHIITVAGKPFPVRTEIEQRPMGKYHDGRRLGKTGQILLEPGELLGTDFRLGAGNVVERHKVDSAMIEGVVAVTEHLSIEPAT